MTWHISVFHVREHNATKCFGKSSTHIRIVYIHHYMQKYPCLRRTAWTIHGGTTRIGLCFPPGFMSEISPFRWKWGFFEHLHCE